MIEFTLRYDGDTKPSSLVRAQVLPRNGSTVRTPDGDKACVVDEVWDFTEDAENGRITIVLLPYEKGVCDVNEEAVP